MKFKLFGFYFRYQEISISALFLEDFVEALFPAFPRYIIPLSCNIFMNINAEK